MPIRDVDKSNEMSEPVIEPELPIVDAHHHLWFFTEATFKAMKANLPPDSPFVQVLNDKLRYLLDEFLADVNTGHNVRATVYMEAHSMYRAQGPEAMKSVGEVEFANGVAAMAASGTFGDVKVGAGIVGNANLSLGDAVEEVLRAHIQAGGGRYRGVRTEVHYDSDPNLFPFYAPRHLLLDKKFRSGFRWLHELGLSFDAWVFEPQLPELIDLARAFPQTQIVLQHVGQPLGMRAMPERGKSGSPFGATIY